MSFDFDFVPSFLSASFFLLIVTAFLSLTPCWRGIRRMPGAIPNSERESEGYGWQHKDGSGRQPKI